MFYLSPIDFFSIATRDAQLARVAIFSDQQRTVDCVDGKEMKIVLSALYQIISKNSGIGEIAVNSDIDRYYLMGLANVYDLNYRANPIYQDDTLRPYLDQNGLLSQNDLIARMAKEAGKCNRWREIDFFILTTKLILGLSPQNPNVRRQFFTAPYAFYLSAFFLTIAICMLILPAKI